MLRTKVMPAKKHSEICLIADSVCKICLESTSSSELIHPCKCEGSIYYVHQTCLKTWILSQPTGLANAHCEVCKHTFAMKYTTINVCTITSESFRWTAKMSLLFKLFFSLLLLLIALCVIIDYAIEGKQLESMVLCAVIIGFMALIISFIIVVLIKRICFSKQPGKWEILEYSEPHSKAYESSDLFTERIVPDMLAIDEGEVVHVDNSREIKNVKDEVCEDNYGAWQVDKTIIIDKASRGS